MNSIEQEIRKRVKAANLPNKIAFLLRRKHRNLKTLYDIDFDPTILSLVNNPSLYEQRDNIPGFDLFFRKSIDILLEHKGQNDIVFAKKQNKWIRAVQEKNKLVIENPGTKNIESWSKVKSISDTRRVHHKSSSSPDKSKFLGGFAFCEPLEFAAFNNGLGILVKPSVLRMYAGFDKVIGISKEKKPVKFICVECARIRRREDSNSEDPLKVHGFRVKMHGYPMSAKDLQADFVGTPLKQSLLPIIKI